MSVKKEFQTETKQLLNLMINSIYTHKEIFLRELISNASDALDKVRFESLKNPEVLGEDKDFSILLSFDKDNKTLIVEDNGIGMSYDEVIENIGTIARSGTKAFIENLKKSGSKSVDGDLIGQFGVGFYSVFMVASEVVLETKKLDSEKGIRWISSGDGTYEIEETDISKRGTKIIIKLRDDAIEELNILESNTIETLIKKYSNYIRYPIKMTVENELKSLNSLESLWSKNSKDIKQEEYNEFYKDNFHDWNEPFETIHFKAEGASVEFTALLFIPSKIPFDYYSKEYRKGLKLYSKNVFIMDKHEDILPDYLSFVKGLVDSPDFSLNISREILQHSKQIEIIRKNIEKKILKALKDKIENDRENYVKFWKEFGKGIKGGLYENIFEKEKMQDLLLFDSSRSDEKMTTLFEYVEGITDENQKDIYYAVGETKEEIERMPQLENILDKGYEVLYLKDAVDEFLLKMMMEYKEKKFKSVSSEEIEETEKEKLKEKEEENKDILEKIKEELKGKVVDVRFTNRLKNSPVCIVSQKDGVSVNMEKILKEMDTFNLKAEKILEINPEHVLFKTIDELYKDKKEDKIVSEFANLLYNEALILEGIKLDNPSDFVKNISEIIATLKK